MGINSTSLVLLHKGYDCNSNKIDTSRFKPSTYEDGITNVCVYSTMRHRVLAKEYC